MRFTPVNIKPTRVIRLASLVFVSGLMATAGQAERLPLRGYTTADGLIRDTVRKIFQDSHGYLWFITPSGLSRFDGYGFTNYGIDQGIPFVSANSMIEDRNGGYWVATNGGGLFHFVPYKSGAASVVPDDSRLRGDFHPITLSENRRTRTIHALLQDRSGRVWAGTSGGLFCLREGGGERRFNPVALPVMDNDALVVWGITEDHAGLLWFATSAGIMSQTGDGRTTRYWATPAQKESAWVLLVD